MDAHRMTSATGGLARSSHLPPLGHRPATGAAWRKGWTPWGTPCSVLVVDGFACAAHATEKSDCPVAKLDVTRGCHKTSVGLAPKAVTTPVAQALVAWTRRHKAGSYRFCDSLL